MKQIFIFFGVIVILLLQSCGGTKKITAPIKTQQTLATPILKDDKYVPFTKDIYNKLVAARIDLKAVQYYIDQQLVLTRGVDNGKIEVAKGGEIKMSNGRQVEEKVFPIYTPGICELVESDGLRISFTSGSSTFKFLNSRSYSPDNFIFSGANWKDGSCDVDYNNNRYRANCGTCSSAADIKLAVKQSFLDNNNINSETIKGRTVGGH